MKKSIGLEGPKISVFESSRFAKLSHCHPRRHPGPVDPPEQRATLRSGPARLGVQSGVEGSGMERRLGENRVGRNDRANENRGREWQVFER